MKKSIKFLTIVGIDIKVAFFVVTSAWKNLLDDLFTSSSIPSISPFPSRATLIYLFDILLNLFFQIVFNDKIEFWLLYVPPNTFFSLNKLFSNSIVFYSTSISSMI